MPDYAMAVIDGTGPWNNDDYAEAMRFSFCSQIVQALGPADCAYERGPSNDGYRMNERGHRARDFLVDRHAKGAARIFLAGYSRGGVAAVMAAEYLEENGVGVEALFLFDPVARHLSKGGVDIPDNVKTVYVALRMYDAALMDKYDHTIGPFWHLVAHNPVRQFFGTAKLFCSPRVRVVSASFLGSHGALGGVGWTHVTEDPLCQRQVGDFMNDALLASRLPVQLRFFPPSSEP